MLPKRLLGHPSRETEPSNASGPMYWSLIKANISMKYLEQCKDGLGLFSRHGCCIRDQVNVHHKVLNAISDVTFYPKKTTLQLAIEEGNRELDNKMLVGSGSDRIHKARAEGYALKLMMLEIQNVAKSTVSGNKLSPELLSLIRKYKSQKDPVACILASPSTQAMRKLLLERRRQKVAEDTSNPLPALPAADSFDSTCGSKRSETPKSPVKAIAWEIEAESSRQFTATALPADSSSAPKLGNMFGIEWSSDEEENDSQCVDVMKVAMDVPKIGSQSVSGQKRNYFEMLGLKVPGPAERAPPSIMVRKPGPNGFVMLETSQGDVETDEPNLFFLNQDKIEVAAKAREAAEMAAKEEKKVKAKAKAAAKKAAKKTAAQPAPKPKAQAKAKAKGKAKAAAVIPAAIDASLPYFRDISITTTTKGVIRSYITGINQTNARALITEITAKRNPQHKTLMETLKQRVETLNWNKDQAVEWRNSQRQN